MELSEIMENKLNQCHKCQQSILREDEIKCTNCKANLHFACGSIVETQFRRMRNEVKSNWKCFDCRNVKIPNSKQEVQAMDDLDKNKVIELNTVLENTNENIKSFDELFSKFTILLDQSSQKLKIDLDNSMNSKLSEIKNELEDITKLIKTNAKQISDLEENQENIKREMLRLKSEVLNLKNENVEGKNEMLKLQLEISDQQQYSKRKNIIISGIPFRKDENIFEIMKALASKLNRNVKEIKLTHRIPTRNVSQTQPIIVKLVDKSDKQQWIKAIKKYKLYANELDDNYPKIKIYINEHLAYLNQKLFKQTQEFKKKYGYMYAWTTDGKIFLKEKPNSKIFRIRSSGDLSILENNYLAKS